MLSSARLWSGQLTDGPHIKLTLSTECTVRGSRTFFWLLRSHSSLLNMPEIPLPPSPPLMNTGVWALEPEEDTEKNHIWSWGPRHLSPSLFSSAWLFLGEKGSEAGRQTSLIAKLFRSTAEGQACVPCCWWGGSLSVTALGSHQLSGVDLHLERRKPRLGEVWSLVQRHPGSDW